MNCSLLTNGRPKANRKNVLLADNQDYLSFPSYTLIDGGGVSVYTNSIDLSTTNPYILGSSSLANSYVKINLSNVQVRSTTGVFANFANAETTFESIVISKEGTALRVVLNGNDLGLQDVTGLVHSFDQINERGSLGFQEDVEILNFSYNSKVFPLNEGNGVDFYSTDGLTSGIRNTSHSGGDDYNNHEIIQRQ